MLKLMLVWTIKERDRENMNKEERERKNKNYDLNNIYNTRCFASDEDRIFKEPDVPLIPTK